MKRYTIYFVLLAAVLMTFSSCRINRKAVPVTPINAQINFDMDDLEYLGTITGSTTQSYFIGIPTGGRRYHQGVLLSQGLLQNPLPGARGYNNALYDALMQMPDADFVLPIAFDSQIDVQFLGRREYLTVRCKAYKIKSK